MGYIKICQCGKIIRNAKGKLCRECQTRVYEIKNRKFSKEDKEYANFMAENFDLGYQVNKLINDIS